MNNRLQRARIAMGVQFGMMLLSMACGDGADPTGGSAAGSGAPLAVHWRGNQSCRGQVGQKGIETTSDETSIDDYSMSKTQVEIRGVQLGLTDSFSCGPLDFHAAVTHSDGGLTTFESNAATSCTSPDGMPLEVRGFSGSVIDLRSGAGGRDVTVKFSVHIRSEQDAAVGDDAAFITCSFELHT